VNANIPGRASLQVVGALRQPFTVEFVTNQEYFLFTLVLNHQKTVGLDACAGCTIPVCLGFQYVELNAPPPGSRVTFNAFPLDSDWLATWQGGGAGTGTPDCGFSTAARTSTWGSVKALFR